jgi:hypothetical protein
VKKPADTVRDDSFEIFAVTVKELEISLFVANTGDRRGALRLYVRDSHIGGRPAVLRSDKERSINCYVAQKPTRRRGAKEMTYLVKVHLLSSTVIDKVSQVTQNVWPRIPT